MNLVMWYAKALVYESGNVVFGQIKFWLNANNASSKYLISLLPFLSNVFKQRINDFYKCSQPN